MYATMKVSPHTAQWPQVRWRLETLTSAPAVEPVTDPGETQFLLNGASELTGSTHPSSDGRFILGFVCGTL